MLLQSARRRPMAGPQPGGEPLWWRRSDGLRGRQQDGRRLRCIVVVVVVLDFPASFAQARKVPPADCT